MQANMNVGQSKIDPATQMAMELREIALKKGKVMKPDFVANLIKSLNKDQLQLLTLIHDHSKALQGELSIAQDENAQLQQKVVEIADQKLKPEDAPQAPQPILQGASPQQEVSEKIPSERISVSKKKTTLFGFSKVKAELRSLIGQDPEVMEKLSGATPQKRKYYCLRLLQQLAAKYCPEGVEPKKWETFIHSSIRHSTTSFEDGNSEFLICDLKELLVNMVDDMSDIEKFLETSAKTKAVEKPKEFLVSQLKTEPDVQKALAEKQEATEEGQEAIKIAKPALVRMKELFASPKEIPELTLLKNFSLIEMETIVKNKKLPTLEELCQGYDEVLKQFNTIVKRYDNVFDRYPAPAYRNEEADEQIEERLIDSFVEELQQGKMPDIVGEYFDPYPMADFIESLARKIASIQDENKLTAAFGCFSIKEQLWLLEEFQLLKKTDQIKLLIPQFMKKVLQAGLAEAIFIQKYCEELIDAKKLGPLYKDILKSLHEPIEGMKK